MKNIFYILLLLPTIIFAQYPSNNGQKITLGEQTTADGLVWRGSISDTALITPFSDTSAYIILDTINNKFYNYNRSTNVWSLAGGGGGGGGTGTVTSITAGTGLTGGTITTSGTLAADTNFLVTRFDTSSMLTNYYRAGRSGIIQAADVPTLNQNTTGSAATLTTERTVQTNLASTSAATFNGSANITPGVTGVLPVANGGTGSASQNFVDLSTNQTVNGLKTFSNIFKSTATVNAVFSAQEPGTAARYYIIRNDAGGMYTGTEGVAGNFLITGIPAYYGVIVARSGLGISANDATEHMRIKSDGEVNIGYGGTDNGAYKLQVNSQILATSSTVATPSDKKYKENITPLTKGLEIVNKLKPVTFNFVNDTENNFSEYEEVGFIAQDVDRALSAESFAKSIVKQTDDSDPNSTYLIGTGNLIPILTKAIQEQQALIKALEQRILILENK